MRWLYGSNIVFVLGAAVSSRRETLRKRKLTVKLPSLLSGIYTYSIKDGNALTKIGKLEVR
jgi:hypothetical protein